MAEISFPGGRAAGHPKRSRAFGARVSPTNPQNAPRSLIYTSIYYIMCAIVSGVTEPPEAPRQFFMWGPTKKSWRLRGGGTFDTELSEQILLYYP